MVFPQRSDASTVSVGEQRLRFWLNCRVPLKSVLNWATISFIDKGCFCLGLGLICSCSITSRCSSALSFCLSICSVFCFDHFRVMFTEVSSSYVSKGECFCQINLLYFLCYKISARYPYLFSEQPIRSKETLLLSSFHIVSFLTTYL